MPMNANGIVRPESKYDSSDAGSIQATVKHDVNGCVRIEFGGKKITWLSLSPPQAVEFANILMKHAEAGMSQRRGAPRLILPR